MQNATNFAAEWTAIIFRDANGGLADLWGRDVPRGYLGTMGCHIDEVLDDLMREGGDLECFDNFSEGDETMVFNYGRGHDDDVLQELHFFPTMTKEELQASLFTLAQWAGLA